MVSFERGLFALEMSSVPEELRVVDVILDAFREMPHAEGTLIQKATSLEMAAIMIDNFKAKTCGSPYSSALFNLTGISSPDELSFLLGNSVTGNPPTVFMVTLKEMQGPVYSVAREKVDREADAGVVDPGRGAPSCIDSYSQSSKAEAGARAAAFLNAYQEEKLELQKAKQTGVIMPAAISPALDLMRQSTTTFCGRRYKRMTGIMRRPKDLDRPAASRS